MIAFIVATLVGLLMASPARSEDSTSTPPSVPEIEEQPFRSVDGLQNGYFWLGSSASGLEFWRTLVTEMRKMREGEAGPTLMKWTTESSTQMVLRFDPVARNLVALYTLGRKFQDTDFEESRAEELCKARKGRFTGKKLELAKYGDARGIDWWKIPFFDDGAVILLESSSTGVRAAKYLNGTKLKEVTETFAVDNFQFTLRQGKGIVSKTNDFASGKVLCSEAIPSGLEYLIEDLAYPDREADKESILFEGTPLIFQLILMSALADREERGKLALEIDNLEGDLEEQGQSNDIKMARVATRLEGKIQEAETTCGEKTKALENKIRVLEKKMEAILKEVERLKNSPAREEEVRREAEETIEEIGEGQEDEIQDEMTRETEGSQEEKDDNDDEEEEVEEKERVAPKEKAKKAEDDMVMFEIRVYSKWATATFTVLIGMVVIQILISMGFKTWKIQMMYSHSAKVHKALREKERDEGETEPFLRERRRVTVGAVREVPRRSRRTDDDDDEPRRFNIPNRGLADPKSTTTR